MLQGRSHVGGTVQIRRAPYTSLLMKIKLNKLPFFLFYQALTSILERQQVKVLDLVPKDVHSTVIALHLFPARSADCASH